MRATFALVALLTLAFAAPAAAPAKADGQIGGSAFPVVYRFYDVTGTTIGQLRASLKENGPKGFYGFTKPHYGKGERCFEGSVRIKLPRWPGLEMAPRLLQWRWKRMYAALVRHEERHAAHFVQAAAQMRQSGCARFEIIRDKWQARTDRYDRLTRHGALEGVFLF